jgi:hypothetical protein
VLEKLLRLRKGMTPKRYRMRKREKERERKRNARGWLWQGSRMRKQNWEHVWKKGNR